MTAVAFVGEEGGGSDLLLESEAIGHEQMAGFEGETLHGLVAAQVRRTPEAVALIWGEESLTYRQMDLRARALARELAGMGVGPEVRVGICLERTLDLPVAILAVLRAGGVYVSLDPGYPRERLAFLCRDAGLAVVLTTGDLVDRLPAGDLPRVLLDEPLPPGATVAEPRGATAANLAYLIYTSGSTGLPKGVAIEHRSAALLVHWSRRHFRDEELAGVLAATSQNFDLSVWELFVPLAWGGTVILADNALALPRLPAREKVRLINTVPSAATELVRQGGIPAGVLTVNLAGEALPADLVRDLLASAGEGERRVLNLYGPSEDTTYSTWAVVRGREKPLIGRPLSGSQAYVVDVGLAPVPFGAVGELVLAGEGLARGYLDRPALTAERFVPDPFHLVVGGRLYRTGDLARWRRRGELEYLGRRDHQVKIRGFRIELDEVAAALRALDAVQEAVVVARPAAAGDLQLVAYVVAAPAGLAEGPQKLTAEALPQQDLPQLDLSQDLRQALSRHLPAHMVPSLFVLLDALPLTPNGKVDRKALPEPLAEGTAPSGTAPRTATEETLAGLWARCLGWSEGLPPVDRSFFEVGGHSLLAIRLLHGIEEAFGLALPLSSLFTAPTIAHQAELVAPTSAPRPADSPKEPPAEPSKEAEAARTEPRSAAESSIGPSTGAPLVQPVALQPQGTEPALFFVHGAGGTVMAFHALSRALGPEQPFYGLEAPGINPGEAPLGTVEELAEAYLAAVRRQQPEGRLHLGGWSMGGVVALEMARRLEARGEAAAPVLLLDSWLPTVLPWPEGRQATLQLLAGFAAELSLPMLTLQKFLGAVADEDPEAVVRSLLARPELQRWLPSGLGEARLMALFRVYRAHSEALRRYRPAAFGGEVRLIQASQAPPADRRRQVEAWQAVSENLRWQEVEGNHFSILQAPQVELVAGWLRGWIAGGQVP